MDNDGIGYQFHYPGELFMFMTYKRGTDAVFLQFKQWRSRTDAD